MPDDDSGGRRRATGEQPHGSPNRHPRVGPRRAGRDRGPPTKTSLRDWTAKMFAPPADPRFLDRDYRTVYKLLCRQFRPATIAQFADVARLARRMLLYHQLSDLHEAASRGKIHVTAAAQGANGVPSGPLFRSLVKICKTCPPTRHPSPTAMVLAHSIIQAVTPWAPNGGYEDYRRAVAELLELRRREQWLQQVAATMAPIAGGSMLPDRPGGSSGGTGLLEAAGPVPVEIQALVAKFAGETGHGAVSVDQPLSSELTAWFSAPAPLFLVEELLDSVGRELDRLDRFMQENRS